MNLCLQSIFLIAVSQRKMELVIAWLEGNLATTTTSYMTFIILNTTYFENINLTNFNPLSVIFCNVKIKYLFPLDMFNVQQL